VDIGKSFWERRLDRFAGYYDEKFGNDWKEEDADFWNKFHTLSRLFLFKTPKVKKMT
jgi:hypothetical protein